MDCLERIAMNAGKGDKRRLAWSKDFADKFDRIFKKRKKDGTRRKPNNKSP
jgi:hypothetical protein